MKLANVKIDINSSVGSKLFCVDSRPAYQYVNGEQTSTRIGTKYTVVLADPGKNFDKLNVTVPGEDLLQKNIEGNIQVTFDNLTLHISFMNGKCYVTGKATAIHVLNNK